MKTVRTPYGLDISDQCNSLLRAHRRSRLVAYTGVSAFTILIGLSLGALVAHGAPIAIAITILITGWGVWGLNYLVTRH